MKRRFLLASLLVIVLGCIAWFIVSSQGPTEPVYEGKRLTLWIYQYARNANVTPRNEIMDAEEAQARKAIHAIGTNALPQLLKWAGYHDSFLKLKVRKVIIWTHSQYLTEFRLKISPDHYHVRAQAAFEVLGADGAPAVPALIYLLGDTDSEVRVTAMHCLNPIGPSAKTAVPALVGCLKETNDSLCYFAIGTLGGIHSEPEVVVPVLIEILSEPKGKPADRTLGIPGSTDMSDAAIRALGRYGPQARAAVPNMLPFLNDQTGYVRSNTTNALKAIDPEAAAKAGVK